MTVIDFHTHVDEAPAFGWIDPPDKIVALLDEAGIDLAVAMTYTDLPGLNPDALDYILGAVAQFPDRLVAFVRLNPNYRTEAAAALEEGIARGCRGLKLHPTTTLAHPADEPTVALLRRCGELGVPALFHCGDDPYTTPQTMALAAAAAPDTAIVLGHMGGYLHVEEAIDAAMNHANLYLETSAMPYPEHIRTAIARVGPERVLFGSDGPGCNPRLELDKVRSLELDPADEALVLGANAARLLRLGDEPIGETPRDGAFVGAAEQPRREPDRSERATDPPKSLDR